MALVEADVSLKDTTNQKPSVCVEDAVIETHLFPWVLWMFLESPCDLGLKGFGDTLQESAASLNSIQLPLCNAMLMVVSRAQGVGVSVPYILATETSLGIWQVASTGCSIPGAVWVSCQAALSTGLPIHTAAVQGDLGNACV